MPLVVGETTKTDH